MQRRLFTFTSLRRVLKRAIVFACLLIANIHTVAQRTKLSVGDHVVKIDGTTFHYVVKGAGPLLVIQAPAWGIGASYLRNGLSPLEKKFTIVTYDPRGTEGSSPVRSSDHLTNADFSEDLERLRRYWGLSQMDVLGHSNGSAIAILYAEKHPDRVRKLILVGSQLLGYTASADEVERTEQQRRRQDPAFDFYLKHIGDPAPRSDREFTEYFRERAGYYFYDPQRSLPIFLTQLTNTMSSSVNQAFVEVPPPAAAPPLADMSKIPADTLVIVGRQDPVCPLQESQVIRDGIPNAMLVSIDHSAHFPWIEQPTEFYDKVERFLQRRQGSD